MWKDSTGSEHDKVPGSFKYSNELYGSIKGGEFFNFLSGFRLPKN